MMSLIGGIIALVLGIIGIVFWWGYFVKALQAGLPVLFILGGALAAYLGIEEIKDKTSSEKFDEDTNDLKNEVETLKEEIKELKKDEDPTPQENEEKKKED
jgi:uncharacterized membrane protein YqjE